MQKLFVANYKMNGNINFYKNVSKQVNKLKSSDTIVLCPPFVYMPFLKIKNKSVKIGAQDIACFSNTKSTGQISAEMLKEFNAVYSIVGHSERRQIGETEDIIADKVKICVENNLCPIICIGEKTKTAKLDILVNQVKSALSKVKTANIVFAYEPVWAIGTGVQPTAKQINKAISIIKQTANASGFNVCVLYGGSVNLKNYKEILSSNVDGLLMGGVSLKVDEFIKIVKGE